MTTRKSPPNELDRLKQRQRVKSYLIGAVVIVLVVAGIILLVSSLGVFNPPKPTETPTLTVTNTVLPTATLVPPTATATVTQTITNTPTPTMTNTPVGPFEYVVQDKDTCWDLAIKYKVDLAALLALNNFPAGTCPIIPGQKIMIPAPGTILPTVTPIDISKMLPGAVINYTVQLGDSLRWIALSFNSTQDAILKLNPTITNANSLLAGQVIKVPVNIATPVPTLAPTSTSAATKTATPVPPTATKSP